MQRILFLGKKDDPLCAQALAFLDRNCQVDSYLGAWGDKLPEEVGYWSGEYIISYLSRWLVPGHVINRATKAAINFHPASPQYPGIGCNNFALYDNASEYGVTCHFMDSKVDTGKIIGTDRFPVFSTDTVESLLARTYAFQISLFYRVVGQIFAGQELAPNGEVWARPPISRSEFNKLTIIEPDMTAEEIQRRVRATTFGKWKPVVKVAGFSFVFDDEAKQG